METLNLAAILITLSALFSYLNHRYIGLPTTIGVMLIALLLSLALIFIGEMGIAQFDDVAERLLSGVDFDTTLMHGMLSFLLFAGALHVDLGDLRQQKWVVTVLATVGVVISTMIVGCLTWLLLHWLGIGIPFIYCLLFGALISPTDPIAVLSTLKSVGIVKSLETKIAGESLFNDGVGVVIFLVIAGLAFNPETVSAGTAVLLFIREAIGGVFFGLGLGYAGFFLLRTVDNYQVEVLITLAIVMGGYSMALALHTSGPIAIVVAGLLIGNRGRVLAMSERTREHLDTFWELVDEVLNAVLFVLIGLEVLVLQFTGEYLAAGLMMIPLVLLSRAISVGVPITVLRLRREFSPHVVKILVWGGIRGGISVALALSLPPSPMRDIVVAMTYVVVVFSILVQGLTIGPLAKRLSERA
ncbi:MAG: sodium:proton antiporter [Arenicellales bacterium]|nr:sodium:proton antiporter [Arenicellales bacterium]